MSQNDIVSKARNLMAVDNPWPWLVYLIFFFIPWTFRFPSWPEIWISLAAVSVFLVVYFASFKTSGVKLMLCVAGMVLLGIGMESVTITSAVFLIYAGAAAANIRPLRHAVATGLVIVAVIVIYSIVVNAHPFYWGPALLFGVMTGVSVYMSRELVESNARLVSSQNQAKRLAAMAERERIARDLHDLLGHTLTVIAVKSDLAHKVIDDDPSRAKQELKDIHQTTREALSDIRAAISGIKNMSLTSELANAKMALASADISTEVQAFNQEFPEHIGAALAMLVKEGVTNIIRHADAEHCEISVSCKNQTAQLVIKDNGRGITGKEGSGIAGMRNRVAALKGRFEIASGDGTTIRAFIPLESST
ncbi:MAG: sensor histidine kinase [Pseudomonadota bacterium]